MNDMKLFKEFASMNTFGACKVQRFTGLSFHNATKLLERWHEAGLIIPYDKPYRFVLNPNNNQ